MNVARNIGGPRRPRTSVYTVKGYIYIAEHRDRLRGRDRERERERERDSSGGRRGRWSDGRGDGPKRPRRRRPPGGPAHGHAAPRRHARARQRRQDHRPLQAQVRSVHQHGADDRLQLREDTREHRQGQGGELPRVGRGGPGEAATPLEVVHEVHGRHHIRRGLVRHREARGGQDGADEDGEEPRECGRSHTHTRQQAGSARRQGGGGAGEAAGRAGAGLDAGQRLRARAAGLRDNRRGPARGPRQSLPADTEAPQARQAQQEARQVGQGLRGLRLRLLTLLEAR